MSRLSPYRKKNPFGLAFFLILLAGLFSLATFHNFLGIRAIPQLVIYPFQAVTLAVWQGVTGLPGGVVGISTLSRENVALRNEVNSLKAQLQLAKGTQSENDRLKAELGFRQRGAYGRKLLAAQVIGRSPTPWFSILEINKGSGAGVKKNQPVIAAEGLAGLVIEVNAWSAKVLLLTDPDSSIAAADQRSRDYGIIAGGFAGNLLMRFVSAGGNVLAGDQIMTSPVSTIFPPNILIGTVQKATKGEHDLFYHIEVKPAVDFSKLEEVFILL